MNQYLSLLVGGYVPTKDIRVHNKDKPCFDDQGMRTFDIKHEVHLRWTVIALLLTGKCVSAVK